MNELKIWVNDNLSDDKLIGCSGDKIYKANPKEEDLQITASEFRRTKIAPASFLGIPLAYIKEIRLQEEKNYIEIFFGQSSYEHYTITDEKTKTEIFEYLATLFPHATVSRETYSKLKAGKKPLYAALILSTIYTWALYISLNIEAGYEYEIKGSPGSLAGAVLALASLGKGKLTLIFTPLLLVALTSFIIKTRIPITYRKIVIRK